MTASIEDALEDLRNGLTKSMPNRPAHEGQNDIYRPRPELRARRSLLRGRPRYRHVMEGLWDIFSDPAFRKVGEILGTESEFESMAGLPQGSIPAADLCRIAAADGVALPVTVEDALALEDPIDVGRTLHVACCADWSDGYDINIGDSLIGTANWLRGWAPDMDFAEWLKLATGLIVYARDTGRERAEVHAKLTPFRAEYARSQDPEIILKEDDGPFDLEGLGK